MHSAGTLAPTDLTVAFTWAVADFVEPPTGTAQTIDLLNARTESPGLRFEVLATTATLDKLADTGGRMQLLRRLAEWQTSPDGTTWTTIFTGRIYRIDSPEATGRLTVTLQDEQLIARTAELWTEAGKVLGSGNPDHYAAPRVWPPGPDGAYGGFEDLITRTYQHLGFTARSGNLVRVPFDYSLAGVGWAPPSQDLAGFLQADAKAERVFGTNATVGNFQTLRARFNGTIYEINVFFHPHTVPTDASFDESLALAVDIINKRTPSGPGSGGDAVYMWLVDPAATIAAGLDENDITEASILAPTHVPTAAFPALIGGRNGMALGQLYKDVYDEIGQRYDPTAVQALIDDTSLPRVRFREPAPANAGEWLTDQLSKPYRIAEFIDSQGRVAPRRIALPSATELPDPATLFRLTAANAGRPHAQWSHAADRLVTVVEAVWSHERLGDGATEAGAVSSDETGFDFIRATDETFTREHVPPPPGTLDDVGRHVEQFSIRGLHRGPLLLLTGTDGNLPIPEQWANVLAGEVFRRWGDGPVEGTISGLSTTDVPDTEPGKFVVIDFPTFAEWGTGRGTPRIVQIISKSPTLSSRIEYRWLDIGPELQVLTAPTVSAVQNTGRPKHAIDVTIASVPTGASYELQTRPSGGTWAPIRTGTVNETVTIQPLASGKTWEFRVRAVQAGRVTSAWSATASAATAALTAPTGLTATAAAGTETDLSWTIGDSEYDLEILLDEATCAAATRVPVSAVGAGTTTYRLLGLAASTTHCAGVRHRDPYGGVSTEATVQFATGAIGTLEAPRRVFVAVEA